MRPVLYQLTLSLRNGCYSLCNLPWWLPRSKITANLCPVWGHHPSEGILGPCAWKLPFVPDPMEGKGVKKSQIRSQKHMSGRTSWFKRQAPWQNSSALVESTEGLATAGLKKGKLAILGMRERTGKGWGILRQVGNICMYRPGEVLTYRGTVQDKKARI